jgi:hypothetical protein
MADVKKVMNRVLKINILFLIIAINFPLKVFSLELGSQGPGGGIAFYVDNSGLHGLEAKAADEGRVFGWTTMGANLSWAEAMGAAKAYGSGWHLPTKDELNLLYQQQTVVGGFSNVYYWSSTEDDSGAWSQGFGRGNRCAESKSSSFRVRAVRAF